ncbi:hypothetical protein BGZ63DRAFT_410304 [Mariannaea sp. PMI_226]|nr:hypothetical protein BGZ63DRAFT_410304 [Mariannaea sp. PMI_226]
MAIDKYIALREHFTQGQLLLPGDNGFEESLQRWSLTCVKPAAAVALPRTAEEVSATVKMATANGLAFNVKGGGHSTAQASSAPSAQGMVIDLSLMRDVMVNPDAKTVTFGGGCVWKDVDEACWEHGLATVGGTVSHTGVGGLILHGGFGVLMGLHGISIDILVSCRVVLADGSIKVASAEENPDLFWAIRGAGSSFGVVTEFTMRAFPQGDVYGGVLLISMDNLPAIVEFMNTWDKTNDGYQAFRTGFCRAPPTLVAGSDKQQPWVIFVHLFHFGDNAQEAGPEYFAPLLKLDAMIKNVGRMPYPSINQIGDKTWAPGRRYLFGGSNFTTPIELSTAITIRDQFTGFVDANPEANGSMFMFECYPNHQICRVPSDATAFNSRGKYYNVGTAWTWESEAMDEKIRENNRQYQTNIRELGYNDTELKDGTGQYLNYVNVASIPAKSVFGTNTDRLFKLKEKYDPQNVFNKPHKLGGQP